MTSLAFKTLTADEQPAHRIVLASAKNKLSPGTDCYYGWDNPRELFGTFAEHATRPVKEKHLNRLVYSCHFAHARRRTKNNVTKMARVLFFDIDHTDKDFGDVADALDGLPWLVHTTFSHTEEDRCFRALVVLSREPTLLEWHTCRRAIIEELRAKGMQVDPHTKDTARGYYLPCNDASVLFDADAPMPSPEQFGPPSEEDLRAVSDSGVGAKYDSNNHRLKPGDGKDAYRTVLRLREELFAGATRGGAMDESSMEKQQLAADAIMCLIKGKAWPAGSTNECEFLVAQTLAVRNMRLDFAEWLTNDERVAQSFAETNAHASTQYGPARLITRIEANREWRAKKLAEREEVVAESNARVAAMFSPRLMARFASTQGEAK